MAAAWDLREIFFPSTFCLLASVFNEQSSAVRQHASHPLVLEWWRSVPEGFQGCSLHHHQHQSVLRLLSNPKKIPGNIAFLDLLHTFFSECLIIGLSNP